MKLFRSDPITSLSRRRLLQLGMSGVSAAAVAQVPTTPDAPGSTSVPATEQWTTLRAQLTLNPQWAYFDTATAGPITRAVLAAEYRALEAMHADQQEFYAARYNAQAVQQLCNRVASWMNCSHDELTLTRGAQAGLEQFADAFIFQPALQTGDELLLCSQLTATALAFWTRWGRLRGLSIKTIVLNSPLQNETQVVESFSSAIGARSRMMVFSHVQHTDGAILPVRELCRTAREHNILSVVDGALSLGAIPVSIADMECDVYATSFRHWLNGPPHSGALYVRRELQAQLPDLSDAAIETLGLNLSAWPTLIAKLPQDFLQYAPQFQALPPALALQENVGRTIIAARIHELSSYAWLQLQSAGLVMLTPAPGQLWTNVLSINAGRRNVADLMSYLRRTDQVMVGGMNLPIGAVLRLSFHIYNSFDDIDRLIRGLIRAIRN